MPRQNTKITPVKPILSSPIITKNNSTLLNSIKEGFGFGLGSSIARNLVNAIPNTIIKTESKPNCFEYKKCLESDDKFR
jgi:uncharacterized spore protein YtfJ